MSEGFFYPGPRLCTGFSAELVDVERGILVVTFNRPNAMNGLNQAMKRGLVEILAQAQMDDHVAVVIITGSGRAFSAGDDLTGQKPAPSELVSEIPHGHRGPMSTYNGLRVLSQALSTAVWCLSVSPGLHGGYWGPKSTTLKPLAAASWVSWGTGVFQVFLFRN